MSLESLPGLRCQKEIINDNVREGFEDRASPSDNEYLHEEGA